MMRILIHKGFWIPVLLIAISCDVIFESDISADRVELISPADSSVVELTEVVFRWEELTGATEYELLVVSPNFSNAGQVVVDTTLEEANSLSAELAGGSYEWSVVAANGAYHTDPTFASFEVLDSADLFDISNSVVILTSPSEGVILTDSAVSFAWQNVDLADTYELMVVSPSFANATRVVLDSTLEDNRLSYELGDGEYEWGVIAVNEFSETSRTENAFSVLIPEEIDPLDLSDDTVIVESPDGAQFALEFFEVTFSWIEVENALGYELVVVAPTFTNIQKTVYDASPEGTRITVPLDSNYLEYEWRIRAVNEDSKSPNTEGQLTVETNED